MFSYYVVAPYESQNGDDSDDEGGIEFTARSGSSSDVNDSKEIMSPVALDCQLPWKRSVCPQETEPVSSITSHSFPNDNQPALAQLPSWADNLDYNHIPALSPRPNVQVPTQNGQLNTSNNNSSSKLSSNQGAEPTANGRVPPLIPTIKIDSPSANNLLSMPSDPYLQTNGAVDRPSTSPVSFSTGSDSPSSELTGSSSNPPASSESEDDEEVEIKPFGKVFLNSKGSVPRFSGVHESTEEISDKQQASESNGKAVMFSLNNEDSSGDESSTYTQF